ncbi:MAG: hypothetical protein LC645_08060 [Geobacteraceae bacterium]|nr:hypothetical protein [Geobacteraceae bacterium]
MKHIDLYHKEFQPYRTPALVRFLQVAAIVLLLGAIGVYFWHTARVAELQTRLQQAESTSNQLNTELSSIEQRLKAQQSDPRLERRISSLRQKLKVQRPLFDTLEHMSSRRGQSIEVLTTLAQQPLPEVWFTRIHLDTHASNVRLEGAGLDPGRISRAFDTLMAQQVFAGQDFSHLRIERDEEGLYQFILILATRVNVEERP